MIKNSQMAKHAKEAMDQNSGGQIEVAKKKMVFTLFKFFVLSKQYYKIKINYFCLSKYFFFYLKNK